MLHADGMAQRATAIAVLAASLSASCADRATDAPDGSDVPDAAAHLDAPATLSDAGDASAPPDDARARSDAPTDAGNPEDAPSAPRGLWFEDVLDRSGMAFVRGAAERYETLADRMSGGVCVLDADGAGALDVFFAMRPVIVDGAPTSAGSSRLFLSDGALHYVDVTSARGLADVGDAWGCLAYDEDGDGDDDLLVYGVGFATLYENDGAVFRSSARLAIPAGRYESITSAAAGDLDDDGDLDLVLGSFLDVDPERGTRESCGIPGHRCIPNVYSLAALPNRLLVREADGHYADATARLAPDLALPESTLALGVSDLDGDGRTDIFVCNDRGGRDRDRPLVRGADGVFRDASLTLGMSGTARGYGTDCMGWTSYDIDGNGRFDHVLSDFEGQTTTVHLCGTDGFCEDVARMAGTLAWSETTFRWGVGLVDVDADGLVELLESTGHIYTTAEIAALALDAPEFEPMHLSSWDGARLVVPMLSREDGSRRVRATRGISIADLDDDGAPDVLLAPALGEPGLLRNVASPRGRWLSVRLVGRGLDREAAGAVVTVETSRGVFRRERHIGEGYAGNFDRRLFFGLGSARGTAIVRVRWPDGELSVTETELDRELRVEQ